MHFFLVYISISGVKIHASNKANKVHAFKDHQHDSRTMPFYVSSQLAFICSKSTIVTLEKGVKYVQSLTLKTPERRRLTLYERRYKI